MLPWERILDETNEFKKFTPVDGSSWFDKTSQYFEVKSVQVLIQLIGYVKYIFQRWDPSPEYEQRVVYFRGQTEHHSSICSLELADASLSPSLFRDLTGKNVIKNIKSRIQKLKNFINKNEELFLDKGERSQYRFAYSAILQQYGMSTDWLDLVDNIWSALWFASHNVLPEKKMRGVNTDKFLLFEKSKKKYSYIYCMSFSGLTAVPEEPGCVVEQLGSPVDMKIIDLRLSVPSIYLRPHAQHGLMIKRKIFDNCHDLSNTLSDIADYKDHLILALRIRTEKVLEWLGKSSLVDYNFFFPSPLFDDGYRRLLSKFRQQENRGYAHYLGHIAHIYG